MTNNLARSNTQGKKNVPLQAVVVSHPTADKFSLLETTLVQSRFWQNLKSACRKAKADPAEFSILIKPDMGFFSRSSATGTDPELVEYLIDLLIERGYSRVAVGESRNSFDLILENRDVLVLADLAGYQFVSPKGNPYEIIDLGEDLVDVAFPAGSVLAGTQLPRAWVDAGYRVCFAKNKTDEENFYALVLHTFSGVLPLRDKDYHYHYRLQIEDVLVELLQQAPPDFCLIDAFLSSHGSAGSRLERPLETRTLIASPNALLADWAGAMKMGLDPFSSPLNAPVLRRQGLPLGHQITGDLAPYTGWINVHPLLASSTQGRSKWMELERLIKPWLARVDQELFPFKDLINQQINAFVMRYLGEIDDNPLAWWGQTALNIGFGSIYAGLDAYRVLYDKKDLRWKETPLNYDYSSVPLQEYENIVGYLDPLKNLLNHIEPDSGGLRWRDLDGSILFEYSREIPVAYDDFVAQVEIHSSIQFMNDYIGGGAVPVKRDEQGHITYQAERNLYLPQPNYLVLYGGKIIDVTKLEYITYGPDFQKIYWKTVKSENSSAEYDDGTVTFSRLENGETQISIFGRQKFALPLFWQVYNPDYNPPLKAFLVSSAYSTFFSRTMTNFESRFEGREVRIGRNWDPNQGQPGFESTEKQPTEHLIEWVEKVGKYVRPSQDQPSNVRTFTSSAPSKAQGIPDEDGFVHFQGPPPGSEAARTGVVPENNPALSSAGLPELPPEIGQAFREFITGLVTAVQKDMGMGPGEKDPL